MPRRCLLSVLSLLCLLVAACASEPEAAPCLPGESVASDAAALDVAVDGGGRSLADDGGVDAVVTQSEGIDAGVTSADDAGGQGRAADPKDAAEPTLQPLPTYPHLAAVIDAVRGSVPTWATFIHAEADGEGWRFREVGYKDTAYKVDFWPASVIKIYPAIAALILIKDIGLSLDAKATFYHRKGQGAWVKDTTRTIGAMIHGSFNCSSNSDYTLLLRLAGVDWINNELLIAAKGFEATTLMVGYVSDRPWVYYRSEEQRIVLSEGGKTHERTHSWSGKAYAKQVGCKIVYTSDGSANCSSTRDMAEHVRRIAYHESLADADRFDLRKADLDWLRYGGKTLQMSNKACSTPWKGIKKVFPDADLLHKGGRVKNYALGVHHIADKQSGVRYSFAVSTQSTKTDTLIRISETVARMARTPAGFLHLENLEDAVNPVKARLLVYSEEAGLLDLVTKPVSADAADPKGWTPLSGSEVSVAAGTDWYDLKSSCLAKSAKYHVKGRLRVVGSESVDSDLHTVIVDAKVACP